MIRSQKFEKKTSDICLASLFFGFFSRKSNYGNLVFKIWWVSLIFCRCKNRQDWIFHLKKKTLIYLRPFNLCRLSNTLCCFFGFLPFILFFLIVIFTFLSYCSQYELMNSICWRLHQPHPCWFIINKFLLTATKIYSRKIKHISKPV